GLSTLFFTEMWERFSFYGLKALLILFMTAAVTQGGLGFTDQRAGNVIGWYGFGVYASAIVGGLLADKVFGQYRSVLLGGIIIALGHFSMAIPTVPTFYLGLCLIVVGTGLLKPNASTMVGALYDEDDARRDAGFSIFYVGINVGAFVAPLIVGTLGQKVDWHVGFACAGVGMVLGLIGWLWIRLGPRQPSSPVKFALGLILVGLGFVLIVPAARMAQERGVLVSPWWLIGLYFLHTIGELCLSPVGLSIVTKLAPARI